ncbi:transcriptional regulator, GntR family [Peptostreptococcaceae bacterium oral taxon 113 str. W5053]|nr:transcriptional regulator, GntR family [Peptostreptococcaceae bacterium oral taxon 113 str. W5053]
MKLIISNNKLIPIYEQITNQIKALIINGDLKSGDKIPSIRALAKQLKVSIITVQRAYDDLQQSGFIETSIGKGSYVLDENIELVKEEQQKAIENLLKEAVESAKKIALSEDNFIKLVQILYKEEEQ